MSANVSIEDANDIRTITIRGRFDFGLQRPFRAAYQEAGLAAYSVPIQGPIDRDDCPQVHAVLDTALSTSGARVLLHKETIDDALAGLLGGYLVHSGLLDNPVLAVAVIQEILGRPLGPVGRSMIPSA